MHLLYSKFMLIIQKLNTGIQRMLSQGCLSDIQDNLQSVVSYSAHSYLQFGNYDQCLSKTNMHYNFLEFKLDNPYSVGAPYIGVCLPQSCDKDFINKSLSLILPQFDLQLISIKDNLDIEAYVYPYDWKFYFTVSLISLLFLLVLITTVFKSKISNRSKKQLILLNCFNLQDSIKLFKYKQNTLNVFNGVKALSMMWVVLGHQYIFKLSYDVNSTTLESQIQSPFFCFLIAGLMAVDIFFFVGGFLVSYSLFKQQIHNRLHLLLAIIHRVLRFWPCYIVAILIYYTIYMHIGWGTLWSVNQPSVEFCDHWWRPLLFIDNFFGDGRDMCLSWGWYMQNDMQSFIYSMLVLLVFSFNKRIGNLFLWLSILGSVVYTFYQCQVNEYKTLAKLQDFASWSTYFGLVYIKPWARCPPYLYGLSFGMFFMDHISYQKKHKDNHIHAVKIPLFTKLKHKFKANRYFKIFFQVFGLFLMLFIIFIITTIQSGMVWPQIAHSLYMSLAKVFYVFALSMILLPSLLGLPSWVSFCLDTKFFNFVGKISFCVYLLHLNIIFRNVYMTRYDFYFTKFTVFPLFVSHLIQSIIVGFIMTVVVQIPFSKIQRHAIANLKGMIVNRQKTETQRSLLSQESVKGNEEPSKVL